MIHNIRKAKPGIQKTNIFSPGNNLNIINSINNLEGGQTQETQNTNSPSKKSVIHSKFARPDFSDDLWFMNDQFLNYIQMNNYKNLDEGLIKNLKQKSPF